MQAGVGAETYEISKGEARELHPWLNLDDVTVVGYEPNSGYADPYMTTMGFIAGARKLGVEVLTETPVVGFLKEGDRITGVRTGKGDFRSEGRRGGKEGVRRVRTGGSAYIKKK